MSRSIDTLRRKIRTAGELQSVVHTMKGLAAAAIGPAERAVDALARYEETIVLGLAACRDALPTSRQTPTNAPSQIVIFGSDQGMVGTFNDQLAVALQAHLASQAGPSRIWPVGERLAAKLAELAVSAEPGRRAPDAVPAMTDLISGLLLEIEAQPAGRLWVIHQRPIAEARHEPIARQLLPFGDDWVRTLHGRPWPSRRRPETPIAPEPTLSHLVIEYAFVALFRACAESLASEHGTRLAAMLRAERNVQESLDGFWRVYHQRRQAAISDEIFDVVAGFEAVGEADR